MINVENEIFDIVATAVRNAYPDIYMIGEYVKSPPKFPCVSLVEIDNSAYRRTQTDSSVENHAELMYELNVYSNKKSGKKSECKAIASLIDDEMAALGFSRSMLQPIPNMDDATIYRMTGRYRAVVSKDKIIYRR
jgi:hypothetical protein